MSTACTTRVTFGCGHVREVMGEWTAQEVSDCATELCEPCLVARIKPIERYLTEVVDGKLVRDGRGVTFATFDVDADEVPEVGVLPEVVSGWAASDDGECAWEATLEVVKGKQVYKVSRS